MDKGRRKRIADICEKIGVGSLIALFAQGVFGPRLSWPALPGAFFILAFAVGFLVMSVALSRED